MIKLTICCLVHHKHFVSYCIVYMLVACAQARMIPQGCTPLLVLVNVKSGGQQGMDLIHSFRKLLNPHQVYDLMNGGPLPGYVVPNGSISRENMNSSDENKHQLILTLWLRTMGYPAVDFCLVLCVI